MAGRGARPRRSAWPSRIWSRVEIDPNLGDAEPDEEIHDLVRASGGLNLGLDFLPGALAFNRAVAGDDRRP